MTCLSVVAPTCTKGGMTVYTCACSLTCESDPTRITAHTYEETVIQQGSFFSDGESEFTCTGCGDSFTSYSEAFDLVEWILEDEVRIYSAIAIGAWLVVRIFRKLFSKKKTGVK